MCLKKLKLTYAEVWRRLSQGLGVHLETDRGVYEAIQEIQRVLRLEPIFIDRSNKPTLLCQERIAPYYALYEKGAMPKYFICPLGISVIDEFYLRGGFNNAILERLNEQESRVVPIPKGKKELEQMRVNAKKVAARLRTEEGRNAAFEYLNKINQSEAGQKLHKLSCERNDYFIIREYTAQMPIRGSGRFGQFSGQVRQMLEYIKDIPAITTDPLREQMKKILDLAKQRLELGRRLSKFGRTIGNRKDKAKINGEQNVYIRGKVLPIDNVDLNDEVNSYEANGKELVNVIMALPVCPC